VLPVRVFVCTWEPSVKLRVIDGRSLTGEGDTVVDDWGSGSDALFFTHEKLNVISTRQAANIPFIFIIFISQEKIQKPVYSIRQQRNRTIKFNDLSPVLHVLPPQQYPGLEESSQQEKQ
jgi:hypothetical protein